MKNKSNSYYRNLFIIISLVIIIVTILYGVLVDNMCLYDNVKRGTFGDMFGALNTIFSGLAFAGIIVTIFMQMQELDDAKTDFKFNRITNLVYKQNDKIDEMISQFKLIDAQGLSGLAGLARLDIDLNSYKNDSSEEIIFNQINYLSDRLTGLHSIFQTIYRSEKVIREIIRENKLQSELSNELIIIFRMNIPDEVTNIANKLLEIESCLQGNEKEFIAKIGLHEEVIDNIKKKFGNLWRMARFVVVAKPD